MEGKQAAITLKNIILRLLGETGINSLGKYTIVKNNVATAETVPAIRIRMPSMETANILKILPNSGIEAIIDPEPTQRFNTAMMNTRVTRHWLITLDQHNPAQTLMDSVEIIYQHNSIACFQLPIIRPAQKTEKGIIPARAILLVAQGVSLPSNY
jgi:hypothetical protein